MSVLVVGLALFIGMHSIYIAAPSMRAAAIARIGYSPWRGVYSLLSLIGFGLIVYGYGLARQDPVILFTPPIWSRHFAFVLMAIAWPLLIASFFPAPTRIGRFVRHPMLMSVTLWSVAHALAIGTLAGVMLATVFFVWTLMARFSLIARPMSETPQTTADPKGDWIAVAVGLLLWALFLFVLHEWLIGVPLL